MEVPKFMQAVKACGENTVRIDTAAPVPSLRDGYILIKVQSVALNPTDWKGVRVFNDKEYRTVGCDASGIVVSGGADSHWNYKPGDRVAGLCYGLRPNDPTSGAFGEYALLKSALSLPVPDHISDEEAATLPVGINTIGQALYYTLKVPLPVASSGPDVLIYGGSTATGMFAIQFARLSGCRVLTTCSRRNFALVKALGAHEVFDYHDGVDIAVAIRKATDDSLYLAFDCVSEGSSLEICANALSSRSGVGKYTATLPVAGKFPRQDVAHGWTSGYTAFGEVYHFLGNPQPAKPDHLEAAQNFWKVTETLLRTKQLHLASMVHRRTGGLAAIPTGLKELSSGQVSAGKLVYSLVDH